MSGNFDRISADCLNQFKYNFTIKAQKTAGSLKVFNLNFRNSFLKHTHFHVFPPRPLTTWIVNEAMPVSRKRNWRVFLWQSRTLPLVLACCCIPRCQDCAPCCRLSMRLSPVFPLRAQTATTSLWSSWVAAGAPALPWPLPVSHIWERRGGMWAAFITSVSNFVFLWELLCWTLSAQREACVCLCVSQKLLVVIVMLSASGWL